MKNQNLPARSCFIACTFFILTSFNPAPDNSNYFSVAWSSQATTGWPAPGVNNRVVMADFDNDGDADILYQTGGNTTAFQYGQSNGDGTFTILTQSSSPFAGLTLPDNQSRSYFAADFDGDGDIDVWAAVNNTTGSYFRNDGSTFSSQSSSTFPAPAAATKSVVCDFDGDGDADILYQTGGASSAFQYARSNGDGTFTIVTQSSSPFNGLSLPDNTNTNYKTGDIDGDGDNDLYVSALSSTGYYFRNDGSSFSSQSTTGWPAPTASGRTCLGDFDGDGDADILYQTGANGTAFGMGISNGDGTMSTTTTLTGTPLAGLSLIDNTGLNYYVGDIDGDKDVDIWSTVNSTTGSSYFFNGRPPYIQTSVPADNATSVSPAANLVLTFNSAVTKGTGNIYIVRTSDNAFVQTIPVSSSSVTGSGTSWTIDPPSNLSTSTNYAIRFDRKTFADGNNEIFTGITGNTAFNFLTAATLPVQLMNFTASTRTDNVLLHWETAMEKNSDAFGIERSADGQHFYTIGSVPAAGNSDLRQTYSFIDATPLQSQAWYRLRQTDIDGTPTISNVVRVSFSKTGSVLSVQGTPGSHQLTINVGAASPNANTLDLYNANGSRVYSMPVSAGSHQLNTTGWSQGMYVAVLRNNHTILAKQSFLIR